MSESIQESTPPQSIDGVGNIDSRDRGFATGERFHAFDAARAIALLLGVLLHAAWSFIPRFTGAPIVDASANSSADILWFVIHVFRMPLFFLIAGFFAHLAYSKRGMLGLIKNRLIRVGLPFVVGWIILYPFIQIAWSWGASASGRYLGDASIWERLKSIYVDGTAFQSRKEGGAFEMKHLWFLYYLLLIYLGSLVVWLLFRFISPLRQRVIAPLDQLTRKLLYFWWTPIAIAVPASPLLYKMSNWRGIDTPHSSLEPELYVLLLYGFFFAIGWFLYRHRQVMPAVSVYRKYYLMAGVMMAAGLYFAYANVRSRGWTTGHSYPQLVPNMVSDWSQFREQLLGRPTSANKGHASEQIAALWHELPVKLQESLEKEPSVGPDLQVAVVSAINEAMRNPGLFSAMNIEKSEQHPSKGSVVHRNRRVVEAAFGGIVLEDVRPVLRTRRAKSIRIIYSIAYGLAMSFLVFGFLGFAFAHLNTRQRVWRYIADASYWIYLVHIPVISFLQVWMAGWALPFVIKLLLLNALGGLFLFGTYHCLVRHTFVGEALTGRSLPRPNLPE